MAFYGRPGFLLRNSSLPFDPHSPNQALHLTDSAEGRFSSDLSCIPPHRQVSLGR